jgi:hypothetical protein
LSAAVLSIGGAYITGYQKCDVEGRRMIISYNKSQVELMRRLDYIQTGVERAMSISDIKHVIGTQPFVYDEFRTRTTRELNYEVIRTGRFIDFSKVKQSLEYVQKQRKENGPPLHFTPRDFIRYGSLAVGEWPDDLTEADLDPAKNFVKVFVYDELTDLLTYNQPVLWPKCNFVESVFGPRSRNRKVIEADSFLSRN